MFFILNIFWNSIKSPFTLLFLFPFISGFAYLAWKKLAFSIMTVNKNFFILGGLNPFKKKYLWKDIVSIEKVDDEGKYHESLYISLTLTKRDIQKNKKVKEHKKIRIKVDNVSVKNEKFGDKAFKRDAYVDIHNPEIDRPEVKAFTEKLKKLGVDCRFSSLSRPIS